MLLFILSEFGKQNRAPFVVCRFRLGTDDKLLLGFLVEERAPQEKRCSFLTLRWHVLTKVLPFSCSTNWCLRTSPLLFDSQLKDWFLRILCFSLFSNWQTTHLLSILFIIGIGFVTEFYKFSLSSFDACMKAKLCSFYSYPLCGASCVRITAPQVAFLPTKSYVFSSELTASFILYYKPVASKLLSWSFLLVSPLLCRKY